MSGKDGIYLENEQSVTFIPCSRSGDLGVGSAAVEVLEAADRKDGNQKGVVLS